MHVSNSFHPYSILRLQPHHPPPSQVLSIYDLDSQEAIQASTRIRTDANRKTATEEQLHEAVSIVGGRLSFLSKVSKARDVVEMARHMRSTEKGWLLSVIGLIPDCDDDVMDEVGFLF
jgi:hypothetical protein